LISEGDKAPEFALQADDGTTVTLDSLSGKNAVLFFYPKDNTSG
jgi:peroxiredoxin Q/BCP